MHKKEFQQRIIPYSNKAYKLAFRFMQNQQEAEDVVQDVFLKLWKNRNELSSVKNNESYIISMIKRHCIDKIRHKNVQLKHRPFLTVSTENTINNNTDKKEIFNEINRTIETLPDQQKQIITLKDIEGFSYEEIAEITGLTIKAIFYNIYDLIVIFKENRHNECCKKIA